MGDQITINKQLFNDRLSSLISAWKADKRSGDHVFNGAGSILVLMGKADESNGYQKFNSLHFWLFGYEFPATLFLLTTERMYVITTSKKAKHLEPLKNGKIPLELLVRGKDPEGNKQLFEKIIETMKTSGKKYGSLAAEKAAGPFIEEWKTAFESPSKELENVDVATAISLAALSAKDESELRSMRNASKACIAILSKYFVDQMSEVLDQERKVKHTELAEKIDTKIDDKAFFKSSSSPKFSSEFDPTFLDWAYGPVVQSGGKYDLKLNAQPDENNLHAGVIIAGLGLRYNSYCSILARTFMVDPNKHQESTYKLLSNVHNTVIKEIREGVMVKDIYNKAVGLVKAKRPELERHFLRNVGAGIGIEIKDSTLVLNSKNSRVLKDGVTVAITTGFTDVKNPDPQDKSSSTYSMFLADTVRVQGQEAVVFTGDATRDLESVSFYFKEDEDEPPVKSKEKKDPRVGAVATKNITKTKLRAERSTQVDDGAEVRRRDHQKELATKKQEEGLVRYAEAGGSTNGAQAKQFKRFESYKRDNQFPSRVKDLKVIVDTKNSTVILPIMGRPVPFHINTIKNASKSDEGNTSYLRINFLSPGQGVGKKDDHPFEDISAHFVRSLTFKSDDGDHMENVSTQITELRRNALKREQEKKEMEDVVEQDKLSEIRNRRPQRLGDLYVRPALDGKRVPGEIEIHANGLRYQSPIRTDQRIDILFSNVKHLFFQPCAHELIVIIHVHLKNPIMIGKKKAKDVQFYREATDIQFDETGNRKRKYRGGDEEEFEAEQQERRRRAELDREFKNFAEKISEAGRNDGVDVDIPFRELSFNGVPFRAGVLCQPTTDCLVQLTEPPFMVITLEEVEIAHLERVQFGLKNFDMVLVFKDFHRPPFHINTVPVENLEAVKEWLDSVNVLCSEGPLNLNWTQIMKTVTADTHAFFADGGWAFLAAESDDEDDEEEEEESDFQVSESELDGLEESSQESEFDDDASADGSEEASVEDDDDESAGDDDD